MGEVSELHSQRLKTKNTRHRISPWLRSLGPPQPPPAASAQSCRLWPRPQLTGSSPGAADSPQLPRLPRAGGAVSSSARARCAPCLRGGDAAAAFFSRRPCSGSHPWPLAGTAPLHTGCPRGAATPQQPRQSPALYREAPPLRKQARLAPPPRKNPGRGEGRDGTGEALAGSVNPPTPPTLLLPTRPTKYYSSKQQGGHL